MGISVYRDPVHIESAPTPVIDCSCLREGLSQGIRKGTKTQGRNRGCSGLAQMPSAYRPPQKGYRGPHIQQKLVPEAHPPATRPQPQLCMGMREHLRLRSLLRPAGIRRGSSCSASPPGGAGQERRKGPRSSLGRIGPSLPSRSPPACGADRPIR